MFKHPVPLAGHATADTSMSDLFVPQILMNVRQSSHVALIPTAPTLWVGSPAPV